MRGLRLIRFCSLCLLCGVARAATPSLPEDFPATFYSLAKLIDQEELSGMDVARGSYWATKYFAAGAVALPYVGDRFRHAKTQGEASMAGLYMTIYGGPSHIAGIQKELETSPKKRTWLRELVGTEANFAASLDRGMQWKSLLRLLPSTDGSGRLASACMSSGDPLVRRAGLFWGYWLAQPSYWKAVHQCAETDRDVLTRRVASHLLDREKAALKN